MDIILRMFFMHLRLARDTRCLNDAGYGELSEGALEVGRMIGNWIKEINNPKTELDLQIDSKSESLPQDRLSVI